jgi:hypothetical protein
MKNRIAIVELPLAVLLALVIAFNAAAKDINLGWSGRVAGPLCLTSSLVKGASSKKKA